MILILGEAANITGPVVASLRSENYRVRHVLPGAGTTSVSPDRLETDFGSPAALEELHRTLGDGDRVGCIVNFLPLCESFRRSGVIDARTTTSLATWTFNIAKEFQEDLRATAGAGGGWFFNVTALDGKFGLGNGSSVCLAGAGTLGVCKTLKRECPALRVRNIDVDAALTERVAERLVDELFADDDRIEIGLTEQSRWRLELAEELPPDEWPPLPLERDSVLLITGGAYGITADIARLLAAPGRRLILVGRSPAPGEEPADLHGLDESGVRQHFVARAQSTKQKTTPQQIEREVRHSLKQRRIRANLKAFEAQGSIVEYHSLDVRDRERFGGLIDGIYQRFGRIDGVLHGAGLIHDKLIRDKTGEQFEEVFSTKVDSALTLAERLRPESLKFLVFFSSIAARFGNMGQADYSAANEFLNKLADCLDRRWPARVVAMNWGPWESGMVSKELARIYQAKGIHLIPVSEGVQFFDRELRLTGSKAAEVVVSASIEQIAAALLGI